MKLHHTTIEKLVGLFSTFGGYTNDQKLRNELAKVDLSVYEQNKEEATSQGNPNLINRVLVPTAALVEKIKEAKQR
jgi:Tfp pilus assembly pilus retraction ATPase PilT